MNSTIDTEPWDLCPAVAASGMMTANSLASVSQHRQMLRQVLI